MEDTRWRLPHGVLPSHVSDIRGKGIGVSHHHITRASPVDDTHAEVSQDSFLRMLCAGLLLCARCVLVRCVQLHRRTTMVQV